jgi:hypothetical protein
MLTMSILLVLVIALTTISSESFLRRDLLQVVCPIAACIVSDVQPSELLCLPSLGHFEADSRRPHPLSFVKRLDSMLNSFFVLWQS